MADAAVDSAKKPRLTNFLLILVLGAMAGAAGFALPWVAGNGLANFGRESDANQETTGSKLAFLEFGEVSVNLSEERLTRYLRVKIILVVDANQEKSLEKHVQKDKVILKNWVIGHLSDKTIEEVKGAVGYERTRREIRDHFNLLLFPDGSEKIHDVLFEEFLIQ
jgi:flagellar basal body-associated protein FliL